MRDLQAVEAAEQVLPLAQAAERHLTYLPHLPHGRQLCRQGRDVSGRWRRSGSSQRRTGSAGWRSDGSGTRERSASRGGGETCGAKVSNWTRQTQRSWTRQAELCCCCTGEMSAQRPS